MAEKEVEYGVLHEVGDMGLGFEVLQEKEQDQVNKAKEQK